MVDQIQNGEWVTFVRTGGIPVTVVRYGGTFVCVTRSGGKLVTFVKYGGQRLTVDRESDLPEDVQEQIGYA